MRLLLCITLLITGPINLSAKIVNACEAKLLDAKTSYQYLDSLINAPLVDQSHRYKLYQHYKRVEGEIKNLEICAGRTRELLGSLAQVHPELYFEVSGLDNRIGSRIDIYVEVGVEELLPKNVFGATFWSPLPSQPDTPESLYGPGTVRVQIRYCHLRKMLRYLVHEMAHALYQVPNLVEYSKYYEQNYQGVCTELGHRCDDPSGLLVKQELKKFDLIRKQKIQCGLAVKQPTVD